MWFSGEGKEWRVGMLEGCVVILTKENIHQQLKFEGLKSMKAGSKRILVD